MSKYFRPWNIDQTLLLPPNVQDFVPKGHVSRFIVELVRESLDLKEITGSYVSGLGQPPFDPRMMVALLLHGYASGLYSSRRIARACRERNDFVMIVALDPPDFRTISDFRMAASPSDASRRSTGPGTRKPLPRPASSPAMRSYPTRTASSSMATSRRRTPIKPSSASRRQWAISTAKPAGAPI